MTVPHTDTDTPHEDHSNGNQQHDRQTDCYSHSVANSEKGLTAAGLNICSDGVGETCIDTMNDVLQM